MALMTSPMTGSEDVDQESKPVQETVQGTKRKRKKDVERSETALKRTEEMEKRE